MDFDKILEKSDMTALLVRYNSNGLGLWLDSVWLGIGWISLDSGSDWVWARFGIG